MRATVGELEVIGISDGVFRMPAAYFGLEEWGLDDWPAHRQLPGDDGTVHLPIGCFIVRSGDRTILIDAGLGPRDLEWIVGGELPGALAAAGFSPADFDTVLLSHVHLDHVGWLVQDGTPYFPNATVRFGSADAALITGDGSYLKPAALEALGPRVELIEGDATIAPGVTTLAAPGHTPGHMAIVLSSGDERALLLGDAITCPVQLEEPDWAAMSDMDKDLAARTRQRLYDELEGRQDRIVGAHFPDLQMGRVLAGKGTRYFS